MDCSAICSSCSLSSLRLTHNPNFSKHELIHKPKTLSFSTAQLQKSHSFYSKPHFTNLFQLGKLHFLQNQSPLLQVPTSNPSMIHCSSTPKNNNFRIWAEKLVFLLASSLIFMGSFKIRPALSLPSTHESSSFKPMEEERDAKDSKSDDNEEEEMYLRILEKNPRDVEALKVVLYGKMRDGKTKEAVEYVERLIVIEPHEVEWRLLQALCYEMMGNLSRAKILFKEILKKQPLLLRALHGLALVMHKNLEGPAVFEMLNKALETARREKRVTEERNIRILIAQMLVIKGNLEEGLKQFQDLVNENPRDFRPYLCQGIIYSLLDKKKEAEEQFMTYHSLVPHEFPQRGFLDDVVLAAKTESPGQLAKDFEVNFSRGK